LIIAGPGRASEALRVIATPSRQAAGPGPGEGGREGGREEKPGTVSFHCCSGPRAGPGIGLSRHEPARRLRDHRIPADNQSSLWSKARAD
jgi:hypothetical protein